MSDLGSNVPPHTWRDAGGAGRVAQPIRTEELLDAVRSALDAATG